MINYLLFNRIKDCRNLFLETRTVLLTNLFEWTSKVLSDIAV